MAILVSCIVLALRSVCYKYTATGNLWTVAEHTGSRSCSTLQISRRVIDWWFVWVHKEKRMRRTPTCGAPVHNLSYTAKCNTRAPESQATCNIGKEMKYGSFRITCARSVRRTEKVNRIQVPTSPKQLQSPTDHSPDMLLIGWVDCGLCKTVKWGLWLCVLRQWYTWSSMDYIALTTRISMTHY
jgi:hypothetical protein